MAERLKQRAMYEVLYRIWSSVSHGETSLKRISGRAGSGMLLVDAIRSPISLPEMSQHACNLTLLVSQGVVEKAVPGLRDYLREHYLSTVKPALESIKTVTING